MAKSIDLCERQRLEKLLDHLREGSLAAVPCELLLEPQPHTRPCVRLVAHYPRLQQVFIGNFRLLAVIKLIPVAALWIVVLGAASLESWLLLGIATPWLREAVQLVLEPVAWFAAGIVSFPVALNLLGHFSWTWNHLILSLTELRHATPDTLQQVPWRAVYTASLGFMGCVRVELENGVVLLLRVPKADRDTLIEIMRELICRHHPS